MPVDKECKNCGALFSVPKCRLETAKYCSTSCRGEMIRKSNPKAISGDCSVCGAGFSRKKTKSIPNSVCTHKCYMQKVKFGRKPNVLCTYCGIEFFVKPSRLRSSRPHGSFCSNTCCAKFRGDAYSGEKNPNYKGRTTDADGYLKRVWSVGARILNGDILPKVLHRAVACEALGVIDIKGFHVHHRDCNVLNNEPWNLAVLSAGDHKWLHKQFGNATLWAHAHGKVDTDTLSSWSDDPGLAKRILVASVENQDAYRIGVVSDRVLSTGIA